MTNGISAAGQRPFVVGQASNDPELQALYDQLLRQSGDPEMALAAVKTAEAWFNDLYGKAMVATRADGQQALAHTLSHKSRIIELASLIPGIAGDNAQVSGQSLRRARQLLNQMGVTDHEPFHGYLRQHVQHDAALAAAGFDVDAVRTTPENAYSHIDKDQLLAVLRQLLEGYQAMGHVDAAQVEGYLDQARQAAELYGVGSHRVAGSEEAAAADEVVSLASLGIPIRI